jgi:hypothetical protein
LFICLFVLFASSPTLALPFGQTRTAEKKLRNPSCRRRRTRTAKKKLRNCPAPAEKKPRNCPSRPKKSPENSFPAEKKLRNKWKNAFSEKFF